MINGDLNSTTPFSDSVDENNTKRAKQEARFRLQNLYDSTIPEQFFLPMPSLQTSQLMSSHSTFQEEASTAQKKFCSLKTRIEETKIPETPKTPATYNFPEEKKLKKCLLETSTFLKNPYFVEKGLPDIVTGLAAQRFGDSKLVEDEVTIRVMYLIDDLKVGTDGFTGKPLPKIRAELTPTGWQLLEVTTKEDLKKCAQ